MRLSLLTSCTTLRVCNLSCVASKTPGSVLQRSQLNYGEVVGTFLHRIELKNQQKKLLAHERRMMKQNDREAKRQRRMMKRNERQSREAKHFLEVYYPKAVKEARKQIRKQELCKEYFTEDGENSPRERRNKSLEEVEKLVEEKVEEFKRKLLAEETNFVAVGGEGAQAAVVHLYDSAQLPLPLICM